MGAELLQDGVGAFYLALYFLTLICGVELWSRVLAPPGELTRKVVHVGGGVLCVLFPFYVTSAWTVAIFAVLMTVLFAIGSRGHLLKSICRVERTTRGSEYYPLSIFIVFTLTRGRIWEYVAAVLVLACADAGAALVGSAYGKYRYTVDDETKSLEGSLVCAVLAFLCTLIPLVALSPLSLPVSVLSSVLIALVVTGIEAISKNGRDNLFVPLAVASILPKITSKPVPEILYQNISLLLMLALISVAVWRSKSMNVGGTLTIILFIYASWSLGSELWAVPLFGAFLLFLLSWRYALGEKAAPYELRVSVAVAAVATPLGILLSANSFNLYDVFLAPFVGSIMYVAGSFLISHRVWNMSARYLEIAELFTYGVFLWLFIVLPTWALQEEASVLLLILFLPLALLVLTGLWASRLRSIKSEGYAWNRYRPLIAFLVSSVVYFVQELGAPHWRHWEF